MALDEREHRMNWLGGIRDGHSLPALGDRLAKKYGGAPAEEAPAPAEAEASAALPVTCPHCQQEFVPGEEMAEEAGELDAAPADGAVAEGAEPEADPDELERLLAGA